MGSLFGFGAAEVEGTATSETLLMKEVIQNMLDDRGKALIANRSPRGDSILVFESHKAAQGFVDARPGSTFE